ncbi:ATP-binding protein [Actinosynnema sp. NPDC050436]|uniref:ATP-binding protein n=1 Tax=Actinosynnema sp. NPDC050436 TaxID=3155659 RepID=UPI0033C245AC
MSSQQRKSTGQDTGQREVTRDLADTPDRAVRALVGELLGGHEGVLADDAVLAADELVGNARQHGVPPCTFRAILDPGRRLRVEVDDCSPDLPHKRPPDEDGGRGLRLVENLATAWGVDAHEDHKTVWAEFALDHLTNDAPHLTGVEPS